MTEIALSVRRSRRPHDIVLRMVRALLLVFVLGTASACGPATLRQWEDSKSYLLMTGPYVVLTGPQRAMIGFRIGGSSEAVVEWTAASGAHGTQLASRDDDFYTAALDGLPRGPLITYQVKIANAVMGEGTFRVGPAPGETKVRFAVFGDTRTNHQVHRAVIEPLAREKLDFYLHTGDMVERGGKDDLWITFFQIERPLMMKTPIFPAIGNHDLGNRGYYVNHFFLDRWNDDKDYYAYDWGNVRLIALDVGIVCKRQCEQYEFVERKLAEGAKNGMIMILFMHNPPYSSGAHGSDLQLQPVIKELAKTYGVELVVTGHDHDYERSRSIDGTTYIVSGSAGAPIRPIRPQSYTAAARTEPHYVLVDVDGDTLSVRAVNLRNEVFDHVTIPLNPPGGRVTPPVDSAPPAGDPKNPITDPTTPNVPVIPPEK